MHGSLFLVTVLTELMLTDDKTFRGFHFHPDKMEHFPIPKEEMEMHEKDPNSTWRFDFKNDSHCVRMEVKPFLLPANISICFKVNHDITKQFAFISFLTTKSGESLVNGFEVNPIIKCGEKY